MHYHYYKIGPPSLLDVLVVVRCVYIAQSMICVFTYFMYSIVHCRGINTPVSFSFHINVHMVSTLGHVCNILFIRMI